MGKVVYNRSTDLHTFLDVQITFTIKLVNLKWEIKIVDVRPSF